MLIFDSFILLNYPKTGSTFARTVLKEIYDRRFRQLSWTEQAKARIGLRRRPDVKELMFPNIKFREIRQKTDQHGCYTQIPVEYRDRPVVAIMRDPFSRLVSDYTFRWWVDNPPLSAELLRAHFPQFPDLDLDNYIRLTEMGARFGRMNRRDVEIAVGDQTLQFIHMFFRNPTAVIEQLDDEYLDSDQFLEDMAPVTFLNQSRLNDDLADFIASHGFSSEECDYVRKRDLVFSTRTKVDVKSLWTPWAIERTRRSERMLFRLMETRGLSWKTPQPAQVEDGKP